MSGSEKGVGSCHELLILPTNARSHCCHSCLNNTLADEVNSIKSLGSSRRGRAKPGEGERTGPKFPLCLTGVENRVCAHVSL